MSRCRVMLVYPYFMTGVNKKQVFPPMGIAQLSASLKQDGAEVAILDCTFLSIDDAIARAERFNADIIGFYVMATMTDRAMALSNLLRKKLTNCVFIAGGPMPTLYPNRFAQSFDIIFRGEAALSFPAFCRDFEPAERECGKIFERDVLDYPGIFLREGRTGAPPVHLTERQINALPIPDRSGFDHEQYQRLSVKETGKKTATLMTTYGCPYECDFCSKPIFGNEVRFRCIDRIAEEIEDIMAYGYNDLWIADDLFTLDEEFLGSFCQRMVRDATGIQWSCLTRVDNVSEEIAGMMKEAGCRKVYLGIESGNDAILRIMNKRIDRSLIVGGVEILKSKGIECSGFFIVGYPGETKGTIEETFAFALALGLDELSFNVPYPLPGSKLYERVAGIREEDWQSENEVKFIYESNFDEAWIQRRIGETMDCFEKRRGR